MAELFLRRTGAGAQAAGSVTERKRTKKKKNKAGCWRNFKALLVNKIDPYVKIILNPSGVAGQTGVIDGGGCDVVFSEQDKNIIYLAFDGMPTEENKVAKPVLTVEAWDEDPGADDFIGRGTAKLGVMEPLVGKEKKIDLVDEAGEEYSGSVAITVVWRPPSNYVHKAAAKPAASPDAKAPDALDVPKQTNVSIANPTSTRTTRSSSAVAPVLDPTKHYLEVTVHSASKLRDIDAKPLLTVPRAGALILVYLGVSIGIMCAKEDWSFIQAFYFCITTLTTVGYGDLLPTTDGSKIFVAFFALVSVGLIAVALGQVTAALFEKQQELVNRTQDKNDPDADRKAARLRTYTTVGFWLFMLFLGILIFAVGEDHTFVDSFYFTIITMTTVGYGDFSFKTDGGRWFCTFWMVFATVSTGRLICELVDSRMQARAAALAEAKRQRVLLKKDALSMLDRSGDGQVDKVEFLGYKLVAMGRCQAKDIDDIMARFDQLDADKSGYLTLDELEDSEN